MAEMLWLYVTYEGLKLKKNTMLTRCFDMLYITYEGLKPYTVPSLPISNHLLYITYEGLKLRRNG